jgi:hypothetical protein
MKKLYEVHCSVDFWIEVEADCEDAAAVIATDSLIERGVHDLTVSSSPVSIEGVKELGE